MLKIHSFLHGMKDKNTSIGINILKKRDKIAAPVIYVLVAALLVFNFNYFKGFSSKSSELRAKAESIINMLDEVEETKTSAIFTTDMQQYTFSNLNLIKNISTEENTEKGEQIEINVISDHALATLPLDQFYSGNIVDKVLIEINHSMNTTNSIDSKASVAYESYSTEEENLSALGDKAIAASNEQSIENQSESGKSKADDSMKNDSSTETSSINESNAKESRSDKLAEKASKSDTSNTVQTEEVSAKGLSLTKNKSMIMKLSGDEKEVLQRIVEAEATGEDIYGKILVANVVLNRVIDEGFPDSISEVVFQKSGSTYQFSPTKDGRYWSVKISDSTIEAVDRALDGEDYSDGAVYFFARKLTSQKKANWFDKSLSRLFRYGCHEFYKDK